MTLARCASFAEWISCISLLLLLSFCSCNMFILQCFPVAFVLCVCWFGFYLYFSYVFAFGCLQRICTSRSPQGILVAPTEQQSYFWKTLNLLMMTLTIIRSFLKWNSPENTILKANYNYTHRLSLAFTNRISSFSLHSCWLPVHYSDGLYLCRKQLVLIHRFATVSTAQGHSVDSCLHGNSHPLAKERTTRSIVWIKLVILHFKEWGGTNSISFMSGYISGY